MGLRGLLYAMQDCMQTGSRSYESWRSSHVSLMPGPRCVAHHKQAAEATAVYASGSNSPSSPSSSGHGMSRARLTSLALVARASVTPSKAASIAPPCL